MKKSFSPMLFGAVAAALIGFSTSAAADFSGAYAPGNWTFSQGNDANIGNGAVDTNAPTSITVIGSDYPEAEEDFDFPALTSFTIVAAGTGKVMFDWNYHTSDIAGPGWDQAGYLLNGIRHQFSYDGSKNSAGDFIPGPNSQNGSASFDVVAGNTFGFYIDSLDSVEGAASLTISSFSAPVPEPGQAAMLALGLLVMGYVGSRKRQQT